MQPEPWRAELEEWRRGKDRFFGTDPQSPLPSEERAAFQGLAYYPIDAAYRFEVPLQAQPPERLEVPQTDGSRATYTRVGVFELALPPGPVVLVAYETPNMPPGELFLPFRDATSGSETYGGGRFLEAHPLPRPGLFRRGEPRYLVDLNRAYHPFCLFNEDFACPLPPRENWLQVPVRAGERLRAAQP